MLRFFGASESAVAKALADAGGDGDGVEATICARDFEIHVDLVVEPGAEARADERSSGARRSRSSAYLFSRDERPVEELVLDLCRERGLTLATAESCTGGMVAARLTSVPGSSDVVLGASRRLRERGEGAELGVPPDVLERHGAVSAETAAAMAAGVRERLRRRRRRRGDRASPGRAAAARRSPSGSCTSTRRTPPARASREFVFPGDRDVDPASRDGRGAPSRCGGF